MPRPAILLTALLMATGCDSSTSRFVEMQADQNRRLAELQTQVHTQQAELQRQRDRLEQERRQIAEHRDHAPLVAESIGSFGLLLACLCPLLLAGMLLGRGDQEPAAEIIADTILSDVDVRSPAGLTSVLLPSVEQSTPRLNDASNPASQETP